MTIQPTSASGAQAAAYSGLGAIAGTHLTAEGLLMYCQAQVGRLDDSISAMMKQQQQNLAHKDALAAGQTAMSKYKPPTNEKQMNEVRDGLQKAIDSLPAGDPVRAQLQTTLDQLNTAYADHSRKWGEVTIVSLDATWYDQKMQVLEDAHDKIKDSADLQMVEMQSIVTQRGTVFQLTTNLLANLKQVDQNTIGNLK